MPRFAEHDHAIPREFDRMRGTQLARDRALAFVHHMIGCGRDTCEPFRRFSLRRKRRETMRILLGDKTRRELTRAKALMSHHRGKKRNIVGNALDDEGIESLRLRSDRRCAIRRVRHQLRDQRIVMDRDLAAFADACIERSVAPSPMPSSLAADRS